MQSLRDNLFYVVLIAAVVLAGGGMAYLYATWMGEYAKELSERDSLQLKIRRKTSPVNPRVVAAQREMVDAYEKHNQTVTAESERLNRKHPMKIANLDGQMVDAFPLSVQQFGNIGNLNYAFTQQYVKQIGMLAKQLDATRPPTDLEIIRFIEDSRSAIINQHKALVRDAESTGQTPPAPLTTDEISEKAQEQGRVSAIVSQAAGGAIYADTSVFDSIFTVPSTGTTEAELWRAQLNLWVQQDIVRAIVNTNKQATAQRGAETKPTVPRSAVKRLVSIDVSETYYTGGTGGRSSSGNEEGGFRGREERPARSGREERPSRSGREERPSRASRADAYDPAPFDDGGGGATGGAATLTQRATGQEYDVIHYSFTVIMPTRYIPALEAQLQRLPYHTVLNHSFSQVVGTDHDRYYYGTDPAAEVVINAEMLLLSSWERPLMPAAVLEALPASALRPADKQDTMDPDEMY